MSSWARRTTPSAKKISAVDPHPPLPLKPPRRNTKTKRDTRYTRYVGSIKTHNQNEAIPSAILWEGHAPRRSGGNAILHYITSPSSSSRLRKRDGTLRQAGRAYSIVSELEVSVKMRETTFQKQRNVGGRKARGKRKATNAGSPGALPSMAV